MKSAPVGATKEKPIVERRLLYRCPVCDRLHRGWQQAMDCCSRRIEAEDGWVCNVCGEFFLTEDDALKCHGPNRPGGLGCGDCGHPQQWHTCSAASDWYRCLDWGCRCDRYQWEVPE